MNFQSDIRSRIEKFLVGVEKPARYVGGEVNSFRKDPGAQRVRVCLAFPDVYEIGQSYMGFHILYHILNKRPATLCERTFAPWPDMERVMRDEGLPLWSVESFLPLSSFDVIGFTLQYELHYTAVLNMLDLSGIPLFASERDERHPLVFGGGASCANPEPVAEFFDAFLLGDGEEGFPEMLDVIERCRLSGVPKRDMLGELARVGGAYVPSFYRPEYASGGGFSGVAPREGASFPVHARVVERLRPEWYPETPLVPLTEVVHDRLSVEIMRGCSRGCRFCGAGMTYRPKRVRPVEDVVNHVEAGIRSSGWEEVSLLSLSSSDYPGLADVVDRIGARLSGKAVSISLSSLRVDNFSLAIAANVAGGRKTGLTFAVEAATQRLRDVINKNLTEEQLFETAKTALEGGWSGFKLYFMIGLPTETDEDVRAIADLLNRLGSLIRESGGRHINVTVSPFVPKPQTPFQWERQDALAELERKMAIIRANLKTKVVTLKETNPRISMIEGLLGRGGRETANVILDAWKRGSRLDGWSEHFDFDRWREAFLAIGIKVEDGGGEIPVGTPCPWSHLHYGVDEGFFLREREAARRGETSPDCDTSCGGCGPYAAFCAAQKALKPQTPPRVQIRSVSDGMYGRKPKAVSTGKTAVPVITGTRFRVKYAKDGTARFIGHLDLVRLFDRTLRRAGVPIAYSQGFHPHPKISFGPPLSLGMRSRAEYADFTLSSPCANVGQMLAKATVEGLDVLAVRPISEKAESLTKIVTLVEYRITCAIDNSLEARMRDILTRERIIVERVTKNGPKEIDIRPGIIDLAVDPGGEGIVMTLGLETGRAARPSEVTTLLFDEGVPFDVTRIEQYAELGGERVSPMEIVR